MSTRERWTIYPLLFLALGAALRSKFTSSFEVGSLASRRLDVALVKGTRVEAATVTCENLVVLGPDNKPRIQLGSTPQKNGRVELYGRDGTVVAALTADPESGAGSLLMLTPSGKPTVMIRSDALGGIVESFSATTPGMPQVLLRVTPGGGLVTTVDREGKSIIEVGHQPGDRGIFALDQHGGMFSVQFVPRAVPPHIERAPAPDGQPEKPDAKPVPAEDKPPVEDADKPEASTTKPAGTNEDPN
jgi:hypothetical protein